MGNALTSKKTNHKLYKCTQAAAVERTFNFELHIDRKLKVAVPSPFFFAEVGRCIM